MRIDRLGAGETAEPLEPIPWDVFSFPVNSLGAAAFPCGYPQGCPRLLLRLQVPRSSEEFLFSTTSAPGKKVTEGEASPCSSLLRWSGLAGGCGVLDLWHQARDKREALSLPGELWAFVLFQGWSTAVGAKLAFASQVIKTQECKAASSQSRWSCLLHKISYF